MAENAELLFFDTFSHESCEEINLDLVQFPKPVLLNELRIIPLGARVQADFPGGVRLGATNPSQFRIEFFVNDLSKAPGAAAFETLGALEYNQNGNIRMEISHRLIPTDGLVLRGWYSTITLAVYGCLTKSIQEHVISNQSALPTSAISNDPRGPPPEPGLITTSATAEWVQQHAQVGAPPSEHTFPPEGEEFEGKYPNATSSHYPYQEEWSSSTPTLVSSHNDAFVPAKKELPYEGPQAEWSEEKVYWDQDKEKETRHRERRSPSLERSRDHTPDYRDRGSVDSRHNDREYYPNKSGSSHHHSSWMEWESSTSRKRPRSPPIHPRTPPLEESSSSSVRKDCSSPTGVAFETFSPGDVESISDGEISVSGDVEAVIEKPAPPEPEANTPVTSPQRPEIDPEQSIDDTEQFEPILSDEDIPDEIDTQEIDFDFNEFTDNPIKTFNPYGFIVQPLSYLSDPSMSEYEWKISHVCSEDYLRFKKVPEAVQLEELFNNCHNFSEKNKESWVISIEKLIPLIPKGLLHTPNREAIIDTLISWVDIGLNFDDALSQPQPGYKIRHIKAGLRLAEILCKCSEPITLDLIERINLHRKLIDLYHMEYMALSIKLTILRTLDSSLRYRSCVELFLNSEVFSVVDENMNENVNGYVKIVDMMQRDQLARVKFALASLLRKFHIYEILSEFNQLILNYDKKLKCKDNDLNDEFDLNLISICLEEIIKYYKNAQTMITHPKRFLPVHSQFDFGPTFSLPEPYGSLFTFFKSHMLLETILVILNSPDMSSDWSLLLLIQEFLSALMETPDGLRFLCSSDTINQIIKILIGATTTVDDNEVVTIGINIQLGLILVYRLQALNYIDVLCNFWDYQTFLKLDPDNPEIIDILHNLYSLTLNPIGKSAVTFVLTRCDYVQSILKFLKPPSKPVDPARKKKSPSRLYVMDLISVIIKFSDYVPFLQRSGSELYEIITKDCQAAESQDLVAWLKPVQNYSLFHYEDISEICELIKKNIDSCTSLPGELITLLRILRFLGTQNCNKDLQPNIDPLNEEYVESKYKYVILQLYSCDGVSHMTSILQKFIDYFDEPYLNSHKLLGGNSLLVLSIMTCCVQLLRRMLIYVIQCQNTDFKDLTAIPILLSTYNLMCFVPVASHAYYEAQKVRKDIIDTLLAYTLPVSNESSTETEALNKSLWTSMIMEVIKFITTSPHVFQNGLLILFTTNSPMKLQLNNFL